MKILNNVAIEGTFLNIIKVIHEKTTVNIILNSEKLKAFLLRSGTRQGCPLSPLLFNLVLKSQPQQTRKRNPNWKGRSKLSLFADDMIL